jgi:protein-S-isoprenylcysteine O-methyltransferase Ste14
MGDPRARAVRNDRSLTVGHLLYAVTFCVLLPASLGVWASAAAKNVSLPVPVSAGVGALLTATGVALSLWGMASIVRWGKGLPMNAYPPACYVTRGAYGFLRHPIYVGFVLACFGVAALTRSSPGFWLVAPAAALGCTALVLGYERLDLQGRFGTALHRPWLSLPPDRDAAAPLGERVAAGVLVFVPWAAAYGALAALGLPPDAVSAYFPAERDWSVWPWTEVFYASTYVFVLAAPFAAKRSADLRRFALEGLLATALISFLFFLTPLVAVPRPFEATGPLGRLLLVERAHDTPGNAFPSFHVVWGFLAARAYGSRWPRWRPLWLAIAVAVAGSCVTTGMHAVADVLAAILVVLLVTRAGRIWETLCRGAEVLANSWREWRLGPVRVIQHGLYGGLAGFLAVTGVGFLAGEDFVWPAVLVSTLVILGAAAVAQWIEGASGFLRPFGYFGGALGGVVGCLVAVPVFGVDFWRIGGAFCAVAPWVVAAGRLRCLVQGCCHGAPSPESVGIRYRHPMSRVARHPELAGQPLHPTPLYSILWNAALGLFLLRLWVLGARLSLVVGLYFLVSGLARFAEEAYRGEPQTPRLAGLRLYQHLALASVLAGVAATTVATGEVGGGFHPNTASVVVGLAFGLVAAAAYGVDLPGSGARFARLT